MVTKSWRHLPIFTSLAAHSSETDDLRQLDTFGIEVEHQPPLRSAFCRTFWTAPQALQGQPVDEAIDLTVAQSEATKLAQLKNLQWHTMRQTLADMLQHAAMLTLEHVVTEMPPQAGVIEIVGWLQITHEDGQDLDEAIQETIIVDMPSEAARKPPTFTRRLAGSFVAALRD